MNSDASRSVTRIATRGSLGLVADAERVALDDVDADVAGAHLLDDVFHQLLVGALLRIQVEVLTICSSRVRLRICCEIDCRRSSMRAVTVERT